jgi:hypothetical protein
MAPPFVVQSDPAAVVCLLEPHPAVTEATSTHGHGGNRDNRTATLRP